MVATLVSVNHQQLSSRSTPFVWKHRCTVWDGTPVNIARSGNKPLRDREPLALDGKVVRGARTAAQAAPQLLSVSTHTTQETLVQVRISDKTNEIPVAQELLPPLALRGRVVTADALHTQTALAPCMLDHGAAYLFTVKDNQPRLRAALAAYFADPHATMRTAQTIDRRRGRTDTRTLCASTRLNGYLRTYFPFPRIAQIARLIRTVRTAEKMTTETVYLITSLSPRHAESRPPARAHAGALAHREPPLVA